ncbi:MAG: hypothetical protein E6Z25_03885, partial [Negativicoccus succinicivorans]|nr:hypothetical protein [Negativicoccus succinicivorans]
MLDKKAKYLVYYKSRMKRHGSLKTEQCNELTPMCGSDYTDPSQLQKSLATRQTNEQSNYHGEFDPGSGRTLAA